MSDRTRKPAQPCQTNRADLGTPTPVVRTAEPPASAGAPEAPFADTRFTITVAGSGAAFPCCGDQRLLVAMEQARQSALPVGCRRGGCGVCRIRVLDGVYDTTPMSAAHVTEEDKAQGYALSCCVFPRSDLVVEAAPRPRPDFPARALAGPSAAPSPRPW